jgi:hypothetical protein
VSEAALENEVVKSLGADMARSMADEVKWRLRPRRRKWPSKSGILNRMVETYGDILSEHGSDQVYPLSRSEFVHLLRRHSPLTEGDEAPGEDSAAPPAHGELSEPDAVTLFNHFYTLDCLRYFHEVRSRAN